MRHAVVNCCPPLRSKIPGIRDEQRNASGSTALASWSWRICCVCMLLSLAAIVSCRWTTLPATWQWHASWHGGNVYTGPTKSAVRCGEGYTGGLGESRREWKLSSVTLRPPAHPAEPPRPTPASGGIPDGAGVPSAGFWVNLVTDCGGYIIGPAGQQPAPPALEGTKQASHAGLMLPRQLLRQVRQRQQPAVLLQRWYLLRLPAGQPLAPWLDGLR